MGRGKGYFQIGSFQPSVDNRLLAYAEDAVGRRQYVLHIKDIVSGRLLADEVPDVEPGFVWADDDRTLFYVEKDPVTLLSKRVKAHVLGTPASADRLVYEEKDDSFYMGLTRTTSDKYICIVLDATVSNEQRCTPAASPGAFAVLAPREREFRYQADHIGDRWVILTNWKAPNYRLMRVSEARAAGGRANWTDLVPHSADVFIDEFQPMNGYIAIAERSGGNKRLRLLTDAGRSSFVASDEPAYAMGLDVNAEPGTDWLRYHYTSLTCSRRLRRPATIRRNTSPSGSGRRRGTGRRSRSLSSTARASGRTARRRCFNMPMAATAFRATPPGRRR
jgi:oligopeptidase B